jgi:hypothetical protein
LAQILFKEVFMSAFLDETGTLVTVSSSNPLPVAQTVGGTEVSSSNPLPVAQTDGLSVSGTATSAAVLFTTSMLNYESITVQVTSAGTSCVIVYEASEDEVTWQWVTGLTVSNVGASPNISYSTTPIILQFPRKALFFRARVSTYGSGTVSVVGSLSKAYGALQGLIFIGGSSTIEGGGAGGANPLAIGLECRTSSKTSVSNATLVRPIATVDGRQITRLNSIPENEWQYAAASGGIVNTADNVLIAAAGAGIKNYLTGFSIANASATASEVVVKDGSTVIWRTYLAANAPIQSIKFVTPLQSSANTALNVACITTGTQTYINAQGYKAP